MPNKKATTKSTVQKAFPNLIVSDSLPVHSRPARQGLSRARVAEKLDRATLADHLVKKSQVQRFDTRPKSSPKADSLIFSKSVFAEGKKIIAYEG